jgi:CheY-like chemotaxis protein
MQQAIHRVLLIDDDSVSLFLTERIIQRTIPGVTLLRADTCQQALAVLADPTLPHPELVLISWVRPMYEKLSIQDFCAGYQRRFSQHCPVIAILAASIEDRNFALLRQAYAGPIIDKPLKDEHVRQLMQLYFSQATTSPVNGVK